MPVSPFEPIRRWPARARMQRMVVSTRRAIPRITCLRDRPVTPWVVVRASAIACLALVGCSQGPKFKPACPALSLIKGAADVTRFVPGGGRDITDTVIDASIKAVPAKCEPGGPGVVKATLSVSADVLRGPAAKTRAGDVIYFVAVTEGERVLDEQDYGLHVTFPPNIDRVTVTGGDIVLNLPVSREKSAAAYQIYVGFRLTPEELEFNRTHAGR